MRSLAYVFRYAIGMPVMVIGIALIVIGVCGPYSVTPMLPQLFALVGIGVVCLTIGIELLHTTWRLLHNPPPHPLHLTIAVSLAILAVALIVTAVSIL
jgi:hypothetical protein